MDTATSNVTSGPTRAVDVAIVGAGISGLAAAWELTRAAHSVAVLESRDRVGGRLLSLDSAGAGRLDLGATWYWPGQSRIEQLIGEFGIRTHPQHIAGDAMYHAPGGSQRVEGNPLDVPAGRFTDGADSLARALAEELPDGAVQLGHPVEGIRATDDHLVLATARADVECRHAILALPPALAVARIAFTPELPPPATRLAAATPVWMAATTKVVVRYQEPFWRHHGLSGSASSHVGPMRELHDMSGPHGDPPALFGFVSAGGSDEPTVAPEAIVRQLVEIFGDAAGAPLTVEIHDWRDGEWTAPPGVERLRALQLVGHPEFRRPLMDGRRHWASTETAEVHPGHIEGALAAASRAADAIAAEAPRGATR
ncbi:MAG: flavin monoamine oxidase family protein [Miltoncostaeaceae bacterium]